MTPSKNKKNQKRGKKEERWYHTLKEETKQSIWAILTFILGLFFILASFGEAGRVGNYINLLSNLLFGTVSFLLPVALFIASLSFVVFFRPHFLAHTFIGIILFLLSGLGMADLILGEKKGGYIGYFISLSLVKLLDFWASLILLLGIFTISLLIILNTSLKIEALISKIFKKKHVEPEEKQTLQEELRSEGNILTSATQAVKNTVDKIKSATGTEEEKFELETTKIKSADFVAPPLDLLEGDKGKPSSGDIKANSNIIKRTLQNFGIEVEMGEINIGPSVTQYTLKPAEGIKLSRIVALQNDLALALAAHPLRIEAPIPGRSLVGIEIPNNTKTIIGLKNLLSEEIFKDISNPLLIALGKDVSGKAIFANLAKMPHLLIAGATGTGKSICIHSLIISLFYKNFPSSLRFIMIDPKRVELTIYNKSPHLLTPVITDAKKTILTLRWACKEMERRYEILMKADMRDIEAYHEKKADYNSLPYLIIVIDELADLMATYPREMEASIVRLAQMSRAVGIHLVVSTQRPSVEVITGLIKANITSRIALQVASQIDSRTILDMGGAEKLLGSGDMLYLAGDTAKPKRIQGPYVSDKEVKRVVNFLAGRYKDVDMEELEEVMESNLKETQTQSSFDLNNLDLAEEIDDELYEEARGLVIKAKKASTSYLQRKLKIGYARAARLMDVLEEKGVVGPADGAKPREVLISEEE
ncbi:MAG: DNA translocase FtsK 4TM domain-containing protein [Patescibacteria group bacterium]